MRLLFVSHSLPPIDQPLENLGGMQRVAIELDQALARQEGVEYSTRFLRSPWSSVHIRSVPFIAFSLVVLWWRARKGELDVVLFSSMVTAAMCVPLRGVFRRNGVMSAAIVHGLDVTTPSAAYQRFVPRVFRALDLVMPVSRATGEECIKRGLDKAKLNPIPNGVDLARFSKPEFQQQRRRPALAVFGPPPAVADSRLVLCSVGRHVRRKGFAWFIREVMPRLASDVQYWLAGEGPETDAIRDEVERGGLSHRVRLLGRISEEELAALYEGADVFVMPNIPVSGDMEGFGVVMLEAGLSGLPTIGARLEGIAEVISDGANGSLVESGNVTEFVEGIREYLGNSARLEAASRSAYAYTSSTFSWDTIGSEYVRVLRRFKNAARGPGAASRAR
jgi:phosphatidyl-myo-inositol dimannoside synthase